MLSQLSAALARCCATSAGTLTVLPSAIIACWLSTVSASPSAGNIYARGNKQRQMTLTATEFLRRFLQHVLPRGFVRIRQFGFLANSCRTARLRLIREPLP